ncbi:hypothetical protein ACQB60_03165 [Actinomycetota bacterium Odt1-20B]
MTPTTSDAKKPEIPSLPIWVTVPIGFVVAFILGEYYDFEWWQRFVTVVTASFLVEAINQAVRRAAHSRKNMGKV